MNLHDAFFGSKGWRKSLKRYLMLAGPWSISVIAVFVIMMESVDHFWRSFLISFVIGEICMFGTFWGSRVVSLFESLYFAHRGWALKERSGVANVARGILFMLPSLHLAYQVVGFLAPRIGVRWVTPDFDDYRYGMLFGIFSTMVYVVWDLYRGKRDADKAIQNLESMNLKTQIAALTAQMNPHLLFNSLNSIASMIHENPESAEAMTVELSNLYRRVLAGVKNDRHSLAAEMGLCKSYLEIEKARFGERLRYEIEVGEGVDATATEIPVLCVQPFVENAVKHGLLSQVAGGTLKVKARSEEPKLIITVEDDGVGYGKSPQSKGTGTAIDNCRERLRMMFGDQGSLDIGAKDPGTRVVLTMPLGRGGKA